MSQAAREPPRHPSPKRFRPAAGLRAGSDCPRAQTTGCSKDPTMRPFSSNRPPTRPRRASYRPNLEALEDRTVPSGASHPFPFDPVTQDPADASPDWPSSGHDWFNTGYNAAERAISPATAPGLTVSWEHAAGFVIGTPIISDGVAYLADAFGVVHAVTAATGAPLWATHVSSAADPLFAAA